MDKIVVCALFGVILLLILCDCCYLAGYKKGTQDMAKFHNSVVVTWDECDGEWLCDEYIVKKWAYLPSYED